MLNTASRIVFAKHFGSVEVTVDETSIHIAPLWLHVDRPNAGGWAVPLTHRKLGERLVRAIEEGAAFSSVDVRTDVNGQTYVNAAHGVFGRTMNADLRKLGF